MGDKKDYLETMIAVEGFDLIAITETWANDGDESFLHISGYDIFFKNRVGRKGGGVLIYVKSCLHARECSTQVGSTETTWVELENKKCSTLIV